MISLLLSIPLLGSLLLLPVSSENKETMRGIALFTSLINLAISMLLWIQFDGNTVQYQFVTNIAEELGATSLTFNVGVDSLSIYFVLLIIFYETERGKDAYLDSRSLRWQPDRRCCKTWLYSKSVRLSRAFAYGIEAYRDSFSSLQQRWAVWSGLCLCTSILGGFVVSLRRLVSRTSCE